MTASCPLSPESKCEDRRAGDGERWKGGRGQPGALEIESHSPGHHQFSLTAPPESPTGTPQGSWACSLRTEPLDQTGSPRRGALDRPLLSPFPPPPVIWGAEPLSLVGALLLPIAGSWVSWDREFWVLWPWRVSGDWVQVAWRRPGTILFPMSCFKGESSVLVLMAPGMQVNQRCHPLGSC